MKVVEIQIYELEELHENAQIIAYEAWKKQAMEDGKKITTMQQFIKEAYYFLFFEDGRRYN